MLFFIKFGSKSEGKKMFLLSWSMFHWFLIVCFSCKSCDGITECYQQITGEILGVFQKLSIAILVCIDRHFQSDACYWFAWISVLALHYCAVPEIGCTCISGTCVPRAVTLHILLPEQNAKVSHVQLLFI